MSNEYFAYWLQEEMVKRGLTKRALARRAGVWHSSINRALEPFPENPPGPKVLKGIARALRLPESFVFRKAGLISRAPENQVDHEMLIHIYEMLRQVGRQDELMTYAEFLLAQLRPGDVEGDEE